MSSNRAEVSRTSEQLLWAPRGSAWKERLRLGIGLGEEGSGEGDG